ncbi:MAG: hypothetical protein QXJ18_01165 [Desulfurococcaceae archaeon]
MSVVVATRLTQEKKELLDAIAEYLHELGKIREPSPSEALRACLYFTVNELLKAIGAEKYTE